MSRMLIVSNRLPINITKKKETIVYAPSTGGLATGLASFYKSYKSLWIGWPGIITNNVEEKYNI
jgi:trehalose 6-phosphate synthase/phosphatase